MQSEGSAQQSAPGCLSQVGWFEGPLRRHIAQTHFPLLVVPAPAGCRAPVPASAVHGVSILSFEEVVRQLQACIQEQRQPAGGLIEREVVGHVCCVCCALCTSG